LIKEDFKDYDYFDFGISNEENGRKTNMGLLYWKEGFGARGVSQDFYKISTKILV
jgi:lipid II:glycine glycyltransferase (peptidoglycan interpeptide bridge formation enzyme)